MCKSPKRQTRRDPPMEVAQNLHTPANRPSRGQSARLQPPPQPQSEQMANQCGSTPAGPQHDFNAVALSASELRDKVRADNQRLGMELSRDSVNWRQHPKHHKSDEKRMSPSKSRNEIKDTASCGNSKGISKEPKHDYFSERPSEIDYDPPEFVPPMSDEEDAEDQEQRSDEKTDSALCQTEIKDEEKPYIWSLYMDYCDPDNSNANTVYHDNDSARKSHLHGAVYKEPKIDWTEWARNEFARVSINNDLQQSKGATKMHSKQVQIHKIYFCYALILIRNSRIKGISNTERAREADGTSSGEEEGI